MRRSCFPTRITWLCVLVPTWWQRRAACISSCAYDGPMLTDSGGFQVFSLGRHAASSTTTALTFTLHLRRRQDPLDARRQHGHPAAAGRRHRHAARPVPAVPGRAREFVAACSGPVRQLGASLPCGAHPRQIRRCSASCQGGMHLDLRMESIRPLDARSSQESLARRSHRLRRLRHRRLFGGRRPRDHVRDAGRRRPRSARGHARAT